MRSNGNWRDCKGWKDSGLPLSTTSNEACKLFDAALAQASGMYDDVSLGGLANTSKTLLEADPTFVMGHVFANNIVLGRTEKPLHLNEELGGKIEKLNELEAAAKNLTEREKNHVKAVNLFARGKRRAAVKVWEDILVDYPTDLLAARQCYITMTNLGMYKENKDIMTRLVPSYTTGTPGYSNILGWQAFCLEENNLFDLAEKTAKKCLEFEPYEAYATHALSHVYLMTGQHEKGLQFTLSTEHQWNKSNILACHNYWHVGLFYHEKGDFDSALGIFDSQIGPRTKKSKSDFNLTDGASLLYRLKLEGLDVGNRWLMLQDTCDSYMYRHGNMHIEGNLLFTCCHDEDKTKRHKLLQSLKEYGRDDDQHWDNKTIVKDVGVPLCEGIIAFEDGNFCRAVDLLYPIRYDITLIGGSHAQRDVFHQTLIHAAMKSNNDYHNRLGRMLLTERKVAKEYDSWTERLMAEFVSNHS